MALGINGITLQRELYSLKKDLILYSKAVNDVDVMNVKQTIQKSNRFLSKFDKSNESNRSSLFLVHTILFS